MIIRRSEIKDIEKIIDIYEDAKKFMRESGNLNQWNGTYPEEELILKDIDEGQSYVCEDNENIAGVFYLGLEHDITYDKIYNGKWLTENKPYAIIHRIAISDKYRGKGISKLLLKFTENEALKRNYISVRIDTHKDNIPMQKFLIKNEFTYCGIIHLLNGDERLAYEKEVKK